MDSLLIEMTTDQITKRKMAKVLGVSVSAISRRQIVLGLYQDKRPTPAKMSESEIAALYNGRRYDDVREPRDYRRFNATPPVRQNGWACSYTVRL